VFFVAESPYHLVRVGKIDAATKTVTRLHNREAHIGAILADIVSLTEDEKATAVIAK
jgi:SP family general alpha glucoside:H+ symporter-like MFS transporter